MVRERYIRQIGSLREDLLRLFSMVEQQLMRSIDCLRSWDVIAAAQIVQNDLLIDQAWRELEERTIHVLATQQPVVASDLRLISVVTAIAGELERIGDYANSIAKRVRRATARPVFLVPPAALHEMAQLALQMVNTSLEAFLRQDVALARSLTERDEQVDQLEDQLRALLLAEARAEPDKIEVAFDLLEMVHALERTADRATNIGERVIFLATSSQTTLN